MKPQKERAIMVYVILLAAGLSLAGYGAYVLFGDGKVVRVEGPKVSVKKESEDEASITLVKPKITVEK